VSEQARKLVPPEVWRRIFQGDPDGQAILEELTALYVDSSQFAPGQTDLTAYRLGKKDLVMEIICKSTGG
jgi:hypothetical protein